MKFGPVAIGAAVGCILAHSLMANGKSLKKGRILSSMDCGVLDAAGLATVMVAQLEPGDVGEDEAAARIAATLCGTGVTCGPAFTGRCNLTADRAGVVVIDAARLVAANAIDEAITVATLAPFARVAAGQMVATVKLITFAAAATSVRAIEEREQSAATRLVRVAPFQPKNAGLIVTTLAGQKDSVIHKRETAVRDRLMALGASLAEVRTISHHQAQLSAAIDAMRHARHDLILVFGASAIVDRGDIVPAALVAAGGRVLHLGMPVDPGNLLMLGDIAETPVIGVPSCAASPKENGFDWVLERLVADLSVTSADIIAMAPGGLLMEIESRPQPRQKPVAATLEPEA
jgi:molybdenum cofactor cytidylyltransferase